MSMNSGSGEQLMCFWLPAVHARAQLFETAFFNREDRETADST
jgi:hypothetical protein